VPDLRLVTRPHFESNHRVPEWIAVILLGIIEGVTEFLPVSSTGHLQLAERWLREQSELFDIVVQCGAVLAVLVVFKARIRSLLQEWRTPAARDYIAKLGLAFALTTAGVLLIRMGAEKWQWKIRKEDVAAAAWAARVAWATLAGGILFLAVEWRLRGKPGRDEISWAVAIAVGMAQVIAATFSGTSRSGGAILFALALGVARPAATEFSFLLGVPTLLAAGGYKLLSAVRHHQVENEKWGMVLLATAVAAITAFLVVKWLLRFVQTHTFVVFGWYRIILGALILIFARP
jgi:undecaprenyl-diphosphatase